MNTPYGEYFELAFQRSKLFFWVPLQYLPFYVLFRVTFCVLISLFPSKGSTVFCKLEVHLFLEKETLFKICFNPGLNLTILRGTGRWCLAHTPYCYWFKIISLGVSGNSAYIWSRSSCYWLGNCLLHVWLDCYVSCSQFCVLIVTVVTRKLSVWSWSIRKWVASGVSVFCLFCYSSWWCAHNFMSYDCYSSAERTSKLLTLVIGGLLILKLDFCGLY